MIFKQIQHEYDFHAIQNYHMSIYRWSIEKEQGESLPQMENLRGRIAKLGSAPIPKFLDQSEAHATLYLSYKEIRVGTSKI